MTSFSMADIVLSVLGTAIAIFLGFVVNNTNKALAQIQDTRESYISKSDHATMEIKNRADVSAATELIRMTREKYVSKEDCLNKEGNISQSVDALGKKMDEGFSKVHVRLDDISKHIDWDNGKAQP